MKVSRRFRTWIFASLLISNGIFLFFLNARMSGIELWASCLGSLLLLATIYGLCLKKPALKAGKQKLHHSR